MKNRKVWDMAVIPLFLIGIVLFSTSVLADQGDRIEDRLDKRGDHIEDRLDNKGDRINDRLDEKGDRINDRLDERGDQIDARLDRASDRAADAGKDRLSERLVIRALLFLSF